MSSRLSSGTAFALLCACASACSSDPAAVQSGSVPGGSSGAAGAADVAGSGGRVAEAGSSGPGGASGAGGAAGRAGSGAAGERAAGSGAAGTGGGGAGPNAQGGGTGGAGTAGAAAVGGAAAAGAGGAGRPATTRPPSRSLDLPTTMERKDIEPWFNIVRPADLSATGEPLPVVAWANGGCLRLDFPWTQMFERWAAAGYVVLALTDGGGGAFGTTTDKEHSALVDWILAEATKAGSPYEGKLDTTRIVAAGNSCGGVTALQITSRDPRVAAVFVLSGSSALGATDTGVMGAIKVPVGYVTGSVQDDIAAPNAASDYEAMAAGVPAMIVSRASGDHVLLSTDATVLDDVKEIALQWMDLVLYGDGEAADALASPKTCASCDAGPWMLMSKHLDTLRK